MLICKISDWFRRVQYWPYFTPRLNIVLLNKKKRIHKETTAFDVYSGNNKKLPIKNKN